MRSDRRYPQSKPETASCSARLLDRSACELKASHERPLWRRHPGGSRKTDAQEPIPREKHTRSLQKRACYFTEDTKADLSNRGLPVLECVSIWGFFFFPPIHGAAESSSTHIRWGLRCPPGRGWTTSRCCCTNRCRPGFLRLGVTSIHVSLT